MKQEMLKKIRILPMLYERSFRRSMEAYDLTQNEVDVLLFLNVFPEFDTAKKICELRQLPKSNVSVAIDRLTKKGYLSHQRDADDRRMVHLKIAEAAGGAMSSIMEEYAEFMDSIFVGFTEEERTVWKTLEDKIVANIIHALRKKAE